MASGQELAGRDLHRAFEVDAAEVKNGTFFMLAETKKREKKRKKKKKTGAEGAGTAPEAPKA